MKKAILILLCAALLAAGAGCKRNTPAPSPSPTATVEPSPEPTPVPKEEMTGMAIDTRIDGSAHAGTQDGKAQVSSVIVAVTVDDEGVITRCRIDEAQSEIAFSAEGKLLTGLDQSFETKRELGAGYGMRGASGIGKEWYEQVDALEDYLTGRTADGVRGVTLTEGKAADADLAASCTISIAGMLETVADAAERATKLGSMTGHRLGVGVVTNAANSKDAVKNATGQAQAYSTYAAVTLDEAGRISSCVIDASQANVHFNETGKIQSDLNAAVSSKNELGDAYGMKKSSEIGKEWYEQAAAFAAYCVGKTPDEIGGIALDDSGAAADADLAASVTIAIGDFLEAVAKAAGNAR